MKTERMSVVFNRIITRFCLVETSSSFRKHLRRALRNLSTIRESKILSAIFMCAPSKDGANETDKGCGHTETGRHSPQHHYSARWMVPAVCHLNVLAHTIHGRSDLCVAGCISGVVLPGQ